MELSKAYKRTELGLIPADWHLKRFEEVMSGFLNGGTPSRSIPAFFRGEILWITSGELNYNIINDTAEKITEEAVRYFNLRVLPKDTFLIAITGLEAETTRGSCGFTGREATTNQSCMALFPGKDLSKSYLYHFYVRFGDQLALKYCQGTKQQSYTGRTARALPIVLPPTVDEQESIAEVLTAADSLIASLEKLIRKKKAIKSGTMQMIFTTGKRLKGFTQPWKSVKLGDVCSHIATGKLDANAMVANGMYRFYTCAREYYYINEYAYDTEALLISGNGSNVGYIHYYKGRFNAYQRTYVLSGFSENISYLKAYLDIYLKDRIFTEANTGNTPYIRLDTLTEMNIYMPTDKEEQKVVAALIMDMDLEIEKLENKLKKYRDLKTGMTNRLLTGKTRLNC